MQLTRQALETEFQVLKAIQWIRVSRDLRDRRIQAINCATGTARPYTKQERRLAVITERRAKKEYGLTEKQISNEPNLRRRIMKIGKQLGIPADVVLDT